MDGGADYTRLEESRQHPIMSYGQSMVDDESSINGSESSTSSSRPINNEISTELKPYLEIGKQLNVRSKSDQLKRSQLLD